MSDGFSPLIPGGLTDQADLARQTARMQDLKRRLEQKNSDEALRETCQDFEAIFMGKMWEQMRNSIPKEGYLHSPYEDQYMAMFDHELSRKFAQAGGIGIADMMYAQLSAALKAKEGQAEQIPVRPLTARDQIGGLPGVSQSPAPEPKTAASDPEPAVAGSEPAVTSSANAVPVSNVAELSDEEAASRARLIAERIAGLDSGRSFALKPDKDGRVGKIVLSDASGQGEGT